MKQISVGQQQQLEQMDPRERMEVLAGQNFREWLNEEGPKKWDGRERSLMKTAFVGGFFAGMDRTLEAFHRPKSWWRRLIESEGFLVASVAGSAILGFVAGFLLLVASLNTPLGQ